ncbi:S8 family serine peptidase [Pseudoxanthomonas putridarboris]|uniref:S8 family serine peptidase n=2 Tax=Pseudoxanthomonas putridarboris TaxID=752605 RepID=A0ABU9J0D9_9GAMM
METDRAMFRRLVRWLGVGMLAGGLAACGGGGGNVRSEPPPVPPPPPPPPPTGLDFTPNVAIDNALTQVNPPAVPAQAGPASLPQYSQHLQLTNAAGALGAGLTGQGVTIGFVDSGVNRNHPALSGRVVRNFVHVDPATNNTSVDDVVGHGTVVAQIAAGRGMGNWGGGVAPGASIVSSRIISDAPPDDDGSGEGNEIRAGQGYGDFFRAINRELADAGARIINNSWGGLYWNDPALTAELASAYRDFVGARGGLIVFANGNAGRNPALRPDPSDNAALPSLSPAAADLERGWLAVAALDPNNPTQLTDYSQACGIAMNYCLAAPGNVVFIDPDARAGDAGYDLYMGGGTSYAAPQVSGAAAVVWSAFPYFSNDLVRQTILGTARDLGAPGVDPEFGWGLLDVSRAANGPGNFAWGDVSVSFSGTSVWRNRIQGEGGLIKSGTGTLILTESAAYTGDTHVRAGSLYLQGGASFSHVRVDKGALVWSGGFANAITNHGTYLVGSTGTAGTYNFTQGPDGNLGVWLGNPLMVSQTARLDGQVSVLGVRRGYTTSAREVLLNAGSIIGTFSSLKAAPNVFLDASLSYDPYNVFLNINRIDVSRAVAALGLPMTTQASAARVEAAMSAIDGQLSGQAAGIGDAFIDAAGRLQQAGSAAEADAALRSLSGELHSMADAMTFDVIGAGRRALSERAGDIAVSPGSGGDWHRALGAPGQGNLGVGRYQADGWMLGSDGRFGTHAFAGLAFGETFASGALSGGRDRGRDRQTQALLYAGSRWGDAHMVGQVGVGRYDRQIDRGLWLGERAQGVATAYTGRYLMASVEAARRFGGKAGTLTPYAGMEYVQLDRDAFIEPGADGFGLMTRDSRMQRLQALAGLRARHAWSHTRLGPLALQAYAEVQHTLHADGLAFDASFVGVDSWSPLPSASGGSSGQFGVALEMAPWRDAMLSFGYDQGIGGWQDGERQWSTRLRIGF